MEMKFRICLSSCMQVSYLLFTTNCPNYCVRVHTGIAILTKLKCQLVLLLLKESMGELSVVTEEVKVRHAQSRAA